ncbi:MAG TPA: hypothetical protein VK213_05290 [Bacteroidales bacterium]|nr:hypothetical protein [Bacteroidales bacterium]
MNRIEPTPNPSRGGDYIVKNDHSISLAKYRKTRNDSPPWRGITYLVNPNLSSILNCLPLTPGEGDSAGEVRIKW